MTGTGKRGRPPKDGKSAMTDAERQRQRRQRLRERDAAVDRVRPDIEDAWRQAEWLRNMARDGPQWCTGRDLWNLVRSLRDLCASLGVDLESSDEPGEPPAPRWLVEQKRLDHIQIAAWDAADVGHVASRLERIRDSLAGRPEHEDMVRAVAHLSVLSQRMKAELRKAANPRPALKSSRNPRP